MKVVAFDGSSRKEGRIAALLRRALAELEAEGIEIELLRLEKDPRTGCYGCGECAHKRDDLCSRPSDDGLQRCVRKMIAADGIIIGSPAYAANCSPATQRLMQRADHAGRTSGGPPSRKVAAAMISGGGPGAARAVGVVERWFRVNGMIVVESGIGIADAGRPAGRAESDEAELELTATVGRKMARILKGRTT
jgi:multimeric flavodoxin WrbA